MAKRAKRMYLDLNLLSEQSLEVLQEMLAYEKNRNTALKAKMELVLAEALVKTVIEERK